MNSFLSMLPHKVFDFSGALRLISSISCSSFDLVRPTLIGSLLASKFYSMLNTFTLGANTEAWETDIPSRLGFGDFDCVIGGISGLGEGILTTSLKEGWSESSENICDSIFSFSSASSSSSKFGGGAKFAISILVFGLTLRPSCYRMLRGI